MIRTRRLVLRSFERGDLRAFSRVLKDPQTMASFGGPYSSVRAREELTHYLDHVERYGFAPFATILDGKLIGDIGFQYLEGGEEVELLYRLLPSFWGRGLATEASDAALDFAFSVLGCGQVVAVIAQSNVASLRLAVRLGFVRGEPGVYYGQPLLRHHVSAELHKRASSGRRSAPIALDAPASAER